jgi:hypothetical protein
MVSFKGYLKEQEELAIVKVEEDKKQKMADFIRKIDDLNDEKFHKFAVDELGMDPDEAETLAYKMLKAFLLKAEEEPDIIPTELGLDLGDGGALGLGDELGDDEDDLDAIGGEEEIVVDDEEDEDW